MKTEISSSRGSSLHSSSPAAKWRGASRCAPWVRFLAGSHTSARGPFAAHLSLGATASERWSGSSVIFEMDARLGSARKPIVPDADPQELRDLTDHGNRFHNDSNPLAYFMVIATHAGLRDAWIVDWILQQAMTRSSNATMDFYHLCPRSSLPGGHPDPSIYQSHFSRK
jgi:hypothetical protein